MNLIELYPALANIPEFAPLLTDTAFTSVPPNTQLFAEGQSCKGFPLLVQGSVRVFKQAENGREIELYRIQSGESCIVTASCLINQTTYQARAVTETETVMCLLTHAQFQRGLDFAAFRNYILALFSDRLIDLMERVEEIAFRRLDSRLAACLLGHGDTLRLTHAQLANELGSVREIISRLLKGFETQGMVRLGREHIEILDPYALRKLADHGK